MNPGNTENRGLRSSLSRLLNDGALDRSAVSEDGVTGRSDTDGSNGLFSGERDDGMIGGGDCVDEGVEVS